MKKIILFFVFLTALGLMLSSAKPSLAFDQNYPLGSPGKSLNYVFKTNNLVYLALSPNGIGGYILAPIYLELLQVNTDNGKIVKIIGENFHSYSFLKLQNRLLYVTDTNINILDFKDKKIVFAYRLPTEITTGGQITAIQMSANQKSILFITVYGPEQEHSVYYSLDIKTKKLTKIKTVKGAMFKL